MSRGRMDHNFNIRLHLPFLGPRWGMAGGIIATLYLCGSILSWLYLFSLDSASGIKILRMEIAVCILLICVNLFGVLKIGYNGYWSSVLVSWIFGIVVNVIGFYIIQVPLLVVSNGDVLQLFLQFCIYILFSALLCAVPTLLICLIMWAIEMIFGY